MLSEDNTIQRQEPGPWPVVAGAAVSLLLGFPAIYAAVISGGAGHGQYVAARALFPASMLLLLIDGTIGVLSIGVGLLFDFHFMQTSRLELRSEDLSRGSGGGVAASCRSHNLLCGRRFPTFLTLKTREGGETSSAMGFTLQPCPLQRPHPKLRRKNNFPTCPRMHSQRFAFVLVRSSEL